MLVCKFLGLGLAMSASLLGRAKYPKFDLQSFEKEEDYIDEYAEGEFIELDIFCKEQGAANLTDFDAKVQFVAEVPPA